MQKQIYRKSEVVCWLSNNQLQSWIIDNNDRATAQAILDGLPQLAAAYDPDSTSDWSVEVPLGRKTITLTVDVESWVLVAIVPWKYSRFFHKRCPCNLPCYLSGERIPGTPRLETMLRWRGLEAARISRI